MTAPVLQTVAEMRMAFVMPAGRSIDDLPIPESTQVSLTNVDWEKRQRFGSQGAEIKRSFKKPKRSFAPSWRVQHAWPQGQPSTHSTTRRARFRRYDAMK